MLRRIAANLEREGQGALTGARVKQAATKRVFGFEIMPAPFVVAHLQVGLTLRALGAPLTEEGDERAGVYLTNALTGWEPHTTKPLPFPELEDERDRAARVKQATPILVMLGNPPYNGFAGMAVHEERELSDAYRVTKRVRPPEGRGLNDLYVRFFRMAERRIVQKTGCGVVCFISNYSWLDGLSYTGMRERYLEAFDAVRIDCLNGDKYKTGKTAPDGGPDPSIFSTPEDPVGIQVGTAIATMIRKSDHAPATEIGFRHLWGQSKRDTLTKTDDAAPLTLYDSVEPTLGLGLPFAPTAVSSGWFAWPELPELFPARFHGVLTNRDALLVDTDLDRLKSRITSYFDASLSHEGIARRYPNAMKDTAQGNARATRDVLLARGGPAESGFVRFTYRPFDNRWLYWEPDGLLDRPRTDYRPHVFDGNLWLSAAQHLRQGAAEPQVCFTEHLGSHHLIERGANLFPAWLLDDGLAAVEKGPERRANLSPPARRYLERLGASVEDLFYHVLAVLHDPAYRQANADALRLGWPRIPLPAWPGPPVSKDRPDAAQDDARAADALAASAARGRELTRPLDPETPVPGVTRGPLEAPAAVIAVPTTIDGTYMMGDDLAVTAGWGHAGQGRAVMPGQGRLVERGYSEDEPAAIAPRSATPPSTSTSTAVRSGATCPPASGATGSAATKCSRSGSPTANETSSDGRCGPTKSRPSPRPRAAPHRSDPVPALRRRPRCFAIVVCISVCRRARLDRPTVVSHESLELERELLPRLRPARHRLVGPRHQIGRLIMVTGVHHVVHDSLTTLPVVNRPAMGVLVPNSSIKRCRKVSTTSALLMPRKSCHPSLLHQRGILVSGAFNAEIERASQPVGTK